MEYTPVADTPAIVAFHLAQAMGDGLQSDLHRIVGSQHLIDASGKGGAR